MVVGGWWLVVGGWWLVVGGWWLVVGGWWLVVGRGKDWRKDDLTREGGHSEREEVEERTAFERLRVYRLAEAMAARIWLAVRGWDHFARDTVGKQLVRAADSVGANIAGGCGRGSFAENRYHVRVARGSLYEAKHFLRSAFRRGLLSEEDIGALKPLLDQLGPSLNAYLRSIGTRCSRANGVPTEVDD